jgi:hypothetical protein
MDGDKTVSATFAKDTFTLTVNQSTGGTIAPTTAAYDAGTVVQLTATADPSYHFVEWTGACTGTGSCSVTMDGDKTVGATFEKIACYVPGLIAAIESANSNPMRPRSIWTLAAATS